MLWGFAGGSKLERILLKGKVFSGKGEGRIYLSIPWVRNFVHDELGFSPYPGTLNLRLIGNQTLRNVLTNVNGTEIVPNKGLCGGKFVRAETEYGEKCAIIFPDVQGYPPNTIEVVAPMRLRETHVLKDGDFFWVKIRL